MFSVERLAKYLDITPFQAKEVRRILDLRLVEGERSEHESDSPEYELWHDSHSRKLYMIDRLKLGGFHGVEITRSTYDTQHTFNGLSYLNTGDTYGSTLLYDHGRGKWLLSSWGDIVEKQPRRFTD